MIKGKKGTAALYFFMIFVVFGILGLALARPLTQTSDEAQNASFNSDGVSLDCANATTYQEKANCTSTDLLPYFYISIIFGLGGVIISKIGK